MRSRQFLRLCAYLLAWATFVTTLSAAEKKSQPMQKLDVAGLAQLIDQEIQKKLVSEKIPASPLADDAEFLRRVYLDLAGVIPTPEQATRFLDSKDSQKRAKLIDELLAQPSFGAHQADIWQDMLLPRNSDNRRLNVDPMSAWLTKKFNENTPWNKLVSEFLTATGNQDENGSVTFYLANPTVDKMTDTVTKLFLGVQLQCAQCHNHPFTDWKQAEYWGMAQFFYKVQPDNARKANKDPDAKLGVVEGAKVTKKALPESAKNVSPKFLQGEEPKLDQSEAYRPVLAKWLTAKENPYFAKALVNRMWHQMFGRGIVNPVDDMHEGNVPSHPELLKSLGEQFIANEFDVKQLLRGICNSQTYQRTSKPTDANGTDTKLFSHMALKALTPEQMYDSLGVALGNSVGRDKVRPAKKGGAPADSRTGFINFFRTDEGADPTEYQGGIPQALRLMNAQRTNKGAVLIDQVAKETDPKKVIEHLYLGTLSRRPSEAEVAKLQAHFGGRSTATASQDVLWALLNCSEFALNH